MDEIQCSNEREACLRCYRENVSDVLVCKEVAEAFSRCAGTAMNVRANSVYTIFDV